MPVSARRCDGRWMSAPTILSAKGWPGAMASASSSSAGFWTTLRRRELDATGGGIASRTHLPADQSRRQGRRYLPPAHRARFRSLRHDRRRVSVSFPGRTTSTANSAARSPASPATAAASAGRWPQARPRHLNKETSHVRNENPLGADCRCFPDRAHRDLGRDAMDRIGAGVSA